ncbi:MAG: hypothetical protein MJZ37_01150 [Bacilli bacterium]|nr:hypothetical protein [Bacilli bacterium]
MSFKFLKEKKVVDCIICLLFLTICHWVQYFRSGQVQAEIRGICSFVALIVTLFSGKKHWNPLLFIWAMAILYWNRFHNYTSFIMILVAIWINPKTKLPYLLIYSLGVLISSILYKDTVTHIVIHALGCSFFYSIFAATYHILNYFKKIIRFLHADVKKLREENRILKERLQEIEKAKKPKLDLTPDEATIISELCAGKEIKELLFWSPNTIYTRLREARERNGCINNDELKSRYITDFPVNTTE